MLTHLEIWPSYHSSLFLPLSPSSPRTPTNKSPNLEAAQNLQYGTLRFKALKIESRNLKGLLCKARRRIIHGDDDDDKDEDGYNEDIALLEMYTQSVTDEVLMVNAVVDDEQAEVVIFKGYSSCLSHKTSANPSRSVLPMKAVIQSIDRIRGPFNPSDFQYIEKGLTWDEFRNRLKNSKPTI